MALRAICVARKIPVDFTQRSLKVRVHHRPLKIEELLKVAFGKEEKGKTA